MERYSTTIQLTVLGPFLTAAASSETYGLDKAFHRGPNNHPVIPGSHIKGKLRMSLAELSASGITSSPFDLDSWFGRPSANNSYEPAHGMLSFSSFTCEEAGLEGTRTRSRTTINPTTLTAQENQLRTMEDLFQSGSSIVWKGSITFFAENLAEASRIVEVLYLGFSWLPILGAEKGVGSGRVKQVHLSKPVLIMPEKSPQSTPEPDSATNSRSLHLRIRPEEYLMIGGVKHPRSNFVRSERIIPGSVVKGALATSLNRAHNIHPTHAPLTADTGKKMPGYELLAAHFADIRVTHAFPALRDLDRPVRIPLSTVTTDEKVYYDQALTNNPALLIDGRAPAYAVDWKKPREYFGEVQPKETFVTRTSIDETTRRSLEGQLFTYTFLCATDSKDQPIEWICNVNFDAITEDKLRQEVIRQFEKAVKAHLSHMGKLNHEVQVEIEHGSAQAAEKNLDLIKDNQVVITLQTDAIMLNPEEVRNLPPGEAITPLYTAFWQQICQDNGYEDCLEMVDCYAQQDFQGGYLYHRYLGAGERKTNPKRYYPYYLTSSGSVFVFRVKKSKEAQECLKRWLSGGLTLPKWAKDKYSQSGRQIWQNCPFVPRNGYGEIAVNLECHWKKSFSLPQESGQANEVLNG